MHRDGGSAAYLSTSRSAKVLYSDSLVYCDGLALVCDKCVWPLLRLQPSLLSEAVVKLHLTPSVKGVSVPRSTISSHEETYLEGPTRSDTEKYLFQLRKRLNGLRVSRFGGG